MILSTAGTLAIPALAGLTGAATLRASVLGLDPDDLVGDCIRFAAAPAGDVVHVIPFIDRDPRKPKTGVAAHPDPMLLRRLAHHVPQTTAYGGGCRKSSFVVNLCNRSGRLSFLNHDGCGRTGRTRRSYAPPLQRKSRAVPGRGVLGRGRPPCLHGLRSEVFVDHNPSRSAPGGRWVLRAAVQ